MCVENKGTYQRTGGHTVAQLVDTLFYKLEGQGVNHCQQGHWNFSFWLHHGHGVTGSRVKIFKDNLTDVMTELTFQSIFKSKSLLKLQFKRNCLFFGQSAMTAQKEFGSTQFCKNTFSDMLLNMTTQRNYISWNQTWSLLSALRHVVWTT